jgi:hypothetical protein
MLSERGRGPRFVAAIFYVPLLCIPRGDPDRHLDIGLVLPPPSSGKRSFFSMRIEGAARAQRGCDTAQSPAQARGIPRPLLPGDNRKVAGYRGFSGVRSIVYSGGVGGGGVRRIELHQCPCG